MLMHADALPRILSGACLEALLHGNLTSKEALALAQQAHKTLTQPHAGLEPASQSSPMQPDQRPIDRILQLPAGQTALHRLAP